MRYAVACLGGRVMRHAGITFGITFGLISTRWCAFIICWQGGLVARCIMGSAELVAAVGEPVR